MSPLSPSPPPGPNVEGTGVEGGAFVLSSWCSGGRSSTSREQVAAEGRPGWSVHGAWAPGEPSTPPGRRGFRMLWRRAQGFPWRPVRGSETHPPERPSKWGLRPGVLLSCPLQASTRQSSPQRGGSWGSAGLWARPPHATPLLHPGPPAQTPQRLPGSLHSHPH